MTSKKKFNLPLFLGFVIVFFVLRYFLFDYNTVENTKNNLPFSYQNIHYTKHAKERMSCRGITADEINEVLEQGTINYDKSELNSASCSTKYAIEHRAQVDQQLIRLIVAPCEKQLSIVTVIDLENNNDCH